MTDLDAGIPGSALVDAAGSGPLTGVDELARRVEAGDFFWLDLAAPLPALVAKVADTLQLTEDLGAWVSNRPGSVRRV